MVYRKRRPPRVLVVEDEVLGGRRWGPRLTTRELTVDEVDTHRDHRCKHERACGNVARREIHKSNGPSWSCCGCPEFGKSKRNGEADERAWRREETATPMSSILDDILGRVGIPAAPDDALTGGEGRGK